MVTMALRAIPYLLSHMARRHLMASSRHTVTHTVHLEALLVHIFLSAPLLISKEALCSISRRLLIIHINRRRMVIRYSLKESPKDIHREVLWDIRMAPLSSLHQVMARLTIDHILHLPHLPHRATRHTNPTIPRISKIPIMVTIVHHILNIPKVDLTTGHIRWIGAAAVEKNGVNALLIMMTDTPEVAAERTVNTTMIRN
jgi:hypothetical protein